MLRPEGLKKGDRVAIIAPASPVYDSVVLSKSIESFKALGFDIILGDSCFAKHGYLAGEDNLRVCEINKFFSDTTIKGIFCLRGGYGSSRLLDGIDYKTIQNNPKVFVGYSDITALQFALYRKCKLITFHGPMITSDFHIQNFYTVDNLLSSITEENYHPQYSLYPINPGSAKGRIIGGNLSVICSLIGSTYSVDFTDKILFIEDIGEEPYRIDRMLNQLKLSNVLNKVAAVVLGQFTDCNAKDSNKNLSLAEVFSYYLSSLEKPIYYGLETGHEPAKITIPQGIKVEIKDNVLIFLESGIRKRLQIT